MSRAHLGSHASVMTPDKSPVLPPMGTILPIPRGTTFHGRMHTSHSQAFTTFTTFWGLPPPQALSGLRKKPRKLRANRGMWVAALQQPLGGTKGPTADPSRALETHTSPAQLPLG